MSSPESSTTARVLLVDDEKPWLRSVALALERSAGISDIIPCNDSREAMGLLQRHPIDLAILDLTMPHLSGEQLLMLMVEKHPDIPVIILSGLNQIDTAVHCMKAGAFDYFVKTVEEDRLVAGVVRALRMRDLERENRQLSSHVLHLELKHPEAFSAIVTDDPQMRSMFRYVEAIAPGRQPVLITGESGTGKELLARAIHQVGRPDGPWVAVNAAGLDDNVFSDTLFGHLRGAFTGADQTRGGMIEQAADGTLFLDEIGDLNGPSQIKLLRLLQENEYLPLGSDRPKKSRARIVVATNQDLKHNLAAGTFRKDLFYRLQSHQAHLPPLRQRPNDIPLLLDYCLEEAAQELGLKAPTPPEELAVLLGTYHFPGNIRELRGMVFEAVSLHQAGKLSMNAFKKAIGHGADKPAPRVTATTPDNESFRLLEFSERLPTLEEAANLVVKEALRRSRNNQTIAAGLLGITRPALSKRLKKIRES
jgi:DNA-binding NtrC family response regulator